MYEKSDAVQWVAREKGSQDKWLSRAAKDGWIRLKQISLTTFIQIGQVPVMFVCMILSNGIVEFMMQRVDDSMLELENQNQLYDPNKPERLTFTVLLIVIAFRTIH